MSKLDSWPMPNKGTKFSDSDLTFLRENVTVSTLAELAEAVGRPYKSVDNTLRKLGIMEQRKTKKRGNMRALMTLADIPFAYFVGIVDGEGTITIDMHRNTKLGTYYLQPKLEISNTNEPLKMQLEAWGLRASSHINNKGLSYWKLSATGYKIDDLLRRLLPLSIVKKRQAELVIEFIQLRLAQRLHERPTPSMLRIVGAVRDLNRRRVPLFR
jgi:hypothetical protein